MQVATTISDQSPAVYAVSCELTAWIAAEYIAQRCSLRTYVADADRTSWAFDMNDDAGSATAATHRRGR